MDKRRKRYICTFVKKEGGKFIEKVCVVAAHGESLARKEVSEKHSVTVKNAKHDEYGNYTDEGIKTIRVMETNTYEGGSTYENFRSDS